MSILTTVKCDGCGADKSDGGDDGWVIVKYGVDDDDSRDFCAPCWQKMWAAVWKQSKQSREIP